MAGEKNENGVNSFMPYMKPPDRTAWEKFSQAIYDGSSNSFFGRTPKSWGQLLIFYTLFYIVLAALFAICLQGLFSTLDERKPTWILEESLIGINPGMGFRPMSDRPEEGSLIAINSLNASSAQRYTDLMNLFLLNYTSRADGRVHCSFEKQPKPGEVCDVDLNMFGDCSPANSFNYKTASPCIFLKLNRIYGWEPHYYNDTANLPSSMPADLVEQIKMESAKGHANQIWVTCKGEKPVDQENINNGDENGFEYFPNRGFPDYYYPFLNYPNYLSPILAVKVKNIKLHVLINIECRAWAKNIEYVGSHRDRQGSVHFELMRD